MPHNNIDCNDCPLRKDCLLYKKNREEEGNCNDILSETSYISGVFCEPCPLKKEPENKEKKEIVFIIPISMN